MDEKQQAPVGSTKVLLNNKEQRYQRHAHPQGELLGAGMGPSAYISPVSMAEPRIVPAFSSPDSGKSGVALAASEEPAGAAGEDLTPPREEVPISHPEDPVSRGKIAPFSPPSSGREESQAVPAPSAEMPRKELSNQEVLSHTASLWKYKEVPKGEPEPHREIRTDCFTGAAHQIMGASVRGKKHKHEGTNCDDWFETAETDGILIAAVSDGAGSKKFSRIGAKTACKSAVDFLGVELDRLLQGESDICGKLSRDMKSTLFSGTAMKLAELAQRAVLRARESVVEAWRERRGDSRYAKVLGRDLLLEDFAATFLLTLVVPLEAIGETLVVACQVGDGMIAAMNTRESFEKALTLLSNPDSGAFSGETEFLTSPSMEQVENLMSRTKLTRKPLDLIFSMTDGVADDYDPGETQLFRLYFDLLANRILTGADMEDIVDRMTPDQMVRLSQEVPRPTSYPRIDGSQNPELVPIQYTGELCDTCRMSLKELWEHPDPLAVMAHSIPQRKDRNPATRLAEWLDNYVIRGSFDDRTLVILRKGGEARV